MDESAFSSDGKYYSNISQDGRLRIWDTETNVLKQEYTPDLHLTSPPSCLQWIVVGVSTHKPRKERRKSLSSEDVQCIALGTTNGKILLYSVTQAKVENVLREEKTGGVHNIFITCIDWHRKYGLFSCNKSNYVYHWDLSAGRVKNKYNVVVDNNTKQGSNVSAIKLIPHNQNSAATFLITASWQVCLWRLHNGSAVILRTLGHKTSKVLLTLASGATTNWLIEGAQNERLLSFWDVSITDDCVPQVNGEPTPSKRQRRKSQTQPEVVQATPKPEVVQATPTYNFVLEDAPRCVDVQLTEGGEGTDLKIAAATRSGVVHYYGHKLNGASLKPIKPSVTIQVTSADAHPLPLQCCRLLDTDILLGYAIGPVTVFERVVPDTKTKTQVLIRGESKQSKKKAKQNATNEVNKVRSEQNNTVTYVEPMGGVSRKRLTPGGEVEVPMEARLENLALDPKSRSSSAVNQNLSRLLKQALHSKDQKLILTVLLKDDARVAKQTVAGLSPNYVPQLLEELVEMASGKTAKCAAACTWTSAVLASHAALLLASTNDTTSNNLAKLLALFTNRRSHLCQLLNLKGRLDLTMAQRSKKDTIDTEEAVLEYHDTSSDDEMEVDKYHSDSDKSWDDKSDAEKSDGGESDAEKSDGGKSDAEKSDGGESDAEKSDGSESDGDKSDAEDADGDKSDMDSGQSD